MSQRPVFWSEMNSLMVLLLYIVGGTHQDVCLLKISAQLHESFVDI